MQTVLLSAILVALLAAIGLLVALYLKQNRTPESLQRTIAELSRIERQELTASVQESVRAFGDIMLKSQQQTAQLQDKRLLELSEQLSIRQQMLLNTVSEQLKKNDQRLLEFSMQSEQKLDNMRLTIQNRISSMQEDNAKQLDKIRDTVDEKLQKTLEERIGQSFKLVSDRLEQVYKGLGEMQTLASGVGDLKRVLSNVKTRGILGEIQLGSILEQILSPEQYEQNIATKPNSRDVVEFAIKLPGDENGVVYLPIDAKFPADAYEQLLNAYDSGDASQVEAAGAVLDKRIKQFAKDIQDKYISPPNTTDFGIMFLPVEGLYAEVVRRGLVEVLQNDYKINIAGPTTMAAMLNALQMGFKTLAIQKRSGEVWNILGAVKGEFDKFGSVLQMTQQRLEQANQELDKLVGVRTRQIQRKLRQVSVLPEGEGEKLLETAGDDEETL